MLHYFITDYFPVTALTHFVLFFKIFPVSLSGFVPSVPVQKKKKTLELDILCAESHWAKDRSRKHGSPVISMRVCVCALYISLATCVYFFFFFCMFFSSTEDWTIYMLCMNLVMMMMPPREMKVFRIVFLHWICKVSRDSKRSHTGSRARHVYANQKRVFKKNNNNSLIV